VDRPVIVTGKHRPHELLLLAVSVLTGAAYTIGTPPPQSVAALLPGWAVRVWAVGLVVSGIVGLAGALTGRGWSLRTEQAGMLLGAAALLWYAAAVIQFGWKGLFATTVTTAWAAANLWRARQIQQDLKGAR
jgi:hypothetical protein